MTEKTEREQVLKLKGLYKSRGLSYRLDIPDMSIKAGDRVMLLGDSGSGKSTALDMLAMVLRPDGGESFIWREGRFKRDLMALWHLRRANVLGSLRLDDLGYVLQTGGLLPFLTVRENILLPAEMKNMTSRDRKRRLEELFSLLKIGHLAKKYPANISVGERQRCAIARAVIHEPLLILADEPTASLDPPTADLVFNLLLELSRKSALVVATHDHQRAARHAFSVYSISFPKAAEKGQAVLAKTAQNT